MPYRGNRKAPIRFLLILNLFLFWKNRVSKIRNNFGKGGKRFLENNVGKPLTHVLAFSHEDAEVEIVDDVLVAMLGKLLHEIDLPHHSLEVLRALDHYLLHGFLLFLASLTFEDKNATFWIE